MSEWHGGKGDRQRPTDKQKFDENFDKIFKNKEVTHWVHYCYSMGRREIPKGKACPWCDTEE